MTLPEYPKTHEDKNKCGYLINFDVAKSGYALHLMTKKEDDISKGKHKIWIFPIDVYNDGKSWGSETVRLKTTPVEISVEKGCLIPIGKGAWSKDFSVFVMLPPTLKRFPEGIRNLSSMPDARWREFLFNSVEEIRHFEAITSGQELSLSRSQAKIRDSEYELIDEIKKKSEFFEKEKTMGGGLIDGTNNDRESKSKEEKS